ncbi:MAG: class I SAM-dependent methyltransferase [Gammaproteobacteria bacterium]|nr:class I SAM-dependent methyltransferase [Gammaproteobacteria bacterium]
MANQSSHADGVAMSGGGVTGSVYSLATIGAKDAIDAATPLVLQALDQMDLSQDTRPFTMSDMGCADGGTSLDMVSTTIQAVRARAPSRPIQVVYADQPGNDYNVLFNIVHGSTDFNSYIDRVENLFVCASATSFYRQIVPANTLDLGFSATAMHWLSKKPTNISNHVHAVGAGGKELEAFIEQGRRDWETILLHRAAELVSGGRLVLINFCKDELGRYLGNTGGANMFDTFNQIWRSFLDQGIITRDEYVNMTLPQYYNSKEEFSAPFLDESSAVYQAGLRLEHIETRVVACPFATDFNNHGDADRFATSYIPTIRSWNESIYFSGLSTERPVEERREIIERYYDTYCQMVRENPKGHGMDYVHAYMVIKKV